MLDTHTHAWGAASEEHPWVNGPILDLVDGFDVHAVYTDDRLLRDMDRNGIDEAVVVGYPICEWMDNWYTLQAVEGSDRLYGIVMLDQFADGAADRLREYMAVDGILGIRLGAACPYDRMWETFDPSVDWLRDAIEEEAFWEAARETDAAVQILCDYTQLDQALELVETYPELTYLFDHFAHAGPGVSTDAETFARFEELAEYDTVAVKVSEVVHRSNEGFPYADMHDAVRRFLDVFGRERVIWGSDYPNVSDEAEYGESLHWLDQVDGLSTGDRKWLTDRSFRRHVGLE
ncbi:amidohydrolase family protein [Halomicrobium urmianum]|uniref:amidohydrolase family protein n=1 Tax=Halomicrobium urmianum TaxID=1586233 RepID=UPI001CD98503|nr:amidohydrolase family protein [Halomicrobium urmianum]